MSLLVESTPRNTIKFDYPLDHREIKQRTDFYSNFIINSDVVLVKPWVVFELTIPGADPFIKHSISGGITVKNLSQKSISVELRLTPNDLTFPDVYVSNVCDYRIILVTGELNLESQQDIDSGQIILSRTFEFFDLTAVEERPFIHVDGGIVTGILNFGNYNGSVVSIETEVIPGSITGSLVLGRYNGSVSVQETDEYETLDLSSTTSNSLLGISVVRTSTSPITGIRFPSIVLNDYLPMSKVISIDNEQSAVINYYSDYENQIITVLSSNGDFEMTL